MIAKHHCPLCVSPFYALSIFTRTFLLQSCPHDRAIALQIERIERQRKFKATPAKRPTATVQT